MNPARALGRVIRIERALASAARELGALRTELLQGPEPKPDPGRPREVLQRLGMWLRTYRQEQGLSRAKLALLAGISRRPGAPKPGRPHFAMGVVLGRKREKT